MFGNAFRDKKSERLGLFMAALIFGLIGTLQLVRVFAGFSVELDGHLVPIWLSAVVGAAAILMSFWMGAILRRNRPIL
jgi:uncharacterized membrane protein YeaQ/YmgE (transglycosylase-associated protein family)